jgi:hypothetical protein
MEQALWGSCAKLAKGKPGKPLVRSLDHSALLLPFTMLQFFVLSASSLERQIVDCFVVPLDLPLQNKLFQRAGTLSSCLESLLDLWRGSKAGCMV